MKRAVLSRPDPLSKSNAVVPRPTLAVIVGAGASIPSGAPSSGDLLTIVQDALVGQVRTESHGRIEQTEFPLREILKNGLSARSEEVGFESIVAAIEELLSYGIGDGPLIQSFTELRAPVRDAARVEVLFGAYEAVIRAILKAFLDGQPKTELQVAAHDSLSAFIRRLGSALRIVLVTLNYDTLLDDALDWCDGFVDTTRDYAEFDPLRWHDRIASDHLLLHVHGSVRFGMRPSTMSGLDVPFGEAVRYATQTLAMRSLRNASSPYADGQLLSASPIIAGGHKSPKLMLNSRPYAYYNASALEAMSYADGLLILGYGFGDAHVNAWIEEYLRLRRRKKLAIVGYRTGKDIGDNLTPTEVFLRKLARRDQHDIYVPVEGGSPPRALHGLIGDAYFVATGVPVSADAEEAVVQYLLAERL